MICVLYEIVDFFQISFIQFIENKLRIKNPALNIVMNLPQSIGSSWLIALG